MQQGPPYCLPRGRCLQTIRNLIPPPILSAPGNRPPVSTPLGAQNLTFLPPSSSGLGCWYSGAPEFNNTRGPSSDPSVPAASPLRPPSAPSSAIPVRPLSSGDPRSSALTQIVLPTQVQFLLVGHPLQVHSCAEAGSSRASRRQDPGLDVNDHAPIPTKRWETDGPLSWKNTPPRPCYPQLAGLRRCLS